MTSRRDFLRSSLILGGGLVLGSEALEAFERLTHTRKSFPSAAVPKEKLFAGSTWMVTGYSYEYWVSDGREWRKVETQEPLHPNTPLTFRSINGATRLVIA